MAFKQATICLNLLVFNRSLSKTVTQTLCRQSLSVVVAIHHFWDCAIFDQRFHCIEHFGDNCTLPKTLHHKAKSFLYSNFFTQPISDSYVFLEFYLGGDPSLEFYRRGDPFILHTSPILLIFGLVICSCILFFIGTLLGLFQWRILRIQINSVSVAISGLGWLVGGMVYMLLFPVYFAACENIYMIHGLGQSEYLFMLGEEIPIIGSLVLAISGISGSWIKARILVHSLNSPNLNPSRSNHE